MRKRGGLMRVNALALGLALVAALLAGSSSAGADVGVGVNLGRIEVDDRLSPGGRYNLPTLGVINTGDEPGDYEVVISYVADQEEKRPPEGWFEFKPQRFFLEPGETQAVDIRISLPSGADPDDYFALIEAHPVSTQEGVTIGVAAATKLTFTVKPSSQFSAWLLQIRNFFEDNSPFSIVLPPTLAGLLLVYLLARRFRLRIERRR